jgi:hypothetical protein
MIKILLNIILVLSFLILLPDSLSAGNLVVSSSSQIKAESEKSRDFRTIRLRTFLETHNSPLSPYSEEFIYFADEYDLDWRLVPAISGVESTFGKRIPANSFNAYGWANGNYSFDSWEDSIKIVSKTLREKYIDNGTETVYQIGKIYAPPSKDWAWKVDYFQKQIDPYELDFDL